MDNLYTGIMSATISRDQAKELMMKRFESECGGQSLSIARKQVSGLRLQYYPYAIYRGDAGARLKGKLAESKEEVIQGSESQRTIQTYEYAIDMEAKGSVEGIAVPLYDASALPGIHKIDSADPSRAGLFSLDMLEKITVAPVTVSDTQALDSAKTLAKEALVNKMLAPHTGKYSGSKETTQCNMQLTDRILVPIYRADVALFGRKHTLMVNANTGELHDTEPEIGQPGISQGYMFQSPAFRKAFKVAAFTVLAIDIIWLIYYLAS